MSNPICNRSHVNVQTKLYSPESDCFYLDKKCFCCMSNAEFTAELKSFVFYKVLCEEAQMVDEGKL